MSQNPFAEGAAYIDGRFMPVAEAKIPITDWGYRRSDATYDVVGVHEGNFFRLEDHIARFRRSMDAFRFAPRESDEEIKTILHHLVALAGLRSAYVAMDCLRGRPPRGTRYHPANAQNYIAAFALPWISLVDEEMMTNGAHLIVAQTVRIPEASVDPRAKNFHWADLTKGQFEAHDRGADFAILLDEAGNITEGAGFNLFLVEDGRVTTPAAGVLEGITRQSVIELCEGLGLSIEVRDVPADALQSADELFMTTTAGGVMPVSRVDGRILSNDRPGPVFRRVHDAFWQRRAEGWHATPVDYQSADRANNNTTTREPA